jgi:ABC-2 type transport system permease protein
MSLITPERPIDDEQGFTALVGQPSWAGKQITGPAALTGDWRQFWHLTFNIAKTEWKMRFFGSALGYFWQLMRPLLLFGVLYVFWTQVVQINKTTPGPEGGQYGVQLLGAIVLFTFLQEATMGSVRAVVENETLVRKIQFPRLAIPLSTVLVALFNMVLNMGVVFIFALASGITPDLKWLELIPAVALLVIFAAGLAMLLSAAYVAFRDIQPIWEVLLQVLFYASPIMIPINVVSTHLDASLLKIYMLNPVAVIVEQYKHAVPNHFVPGAGAAAYGGYAFTAIPVAFIFVVFVLGFYVFNRMAPHVAENL